MKKIVLSLTAAVLLSCASAYHAPACSAAAPVGSFEHYIETGEFKSQLENGFYYDIAEGPSGKSAVIRHYIGTESKVSVPETLGGMPVTIIDFFGDSSLDVITEITLPKSIKADEKTYLSLTNQLKNLSSITVAEDNPELASKDGVLFTKDFSILASYPAAKTDVSYIEPDTVKSDYGFSPNSFIKEITFSSNSEYTSIRNCGHTNIEKAVIPPNVKRIEEYAFEFCSRLNEIQWGEGIEHIGTEAFWNCTSLQELVLPKNVTYIGPRAFFRCDGLKSVTLPFGLKTIGSSAFSCDSLTKVTIPDSVLNVGFSAFDRLDGSSIKIKKAPYLKKIAHKYISGEVRYTYAAKVKVKIKGKTKKYSAADISKFKAGKMALVIRKGERTALEPVVNVKKGLGRAERYGDYKNVGKKQSGTPDRTILSYSSDNKKVVTVNKNGTIKGVKKGFAKVCMTLRTTGEKCYVKVIVK